MQRNLKHFTNPSFWDSYSQLPLTIQELTSKNFDLLKSDPQHPSLHFKKVGRFWSSRVGRKYRAAAVETVEGFIWFWIGTHSEYDKLIK